MQRKQWNSTDIVNHQWTRWAAVVDVRHNFDVNAAVARLLNDLADQFWSSIGADQNLIGEIGPRNLNQSINGAEHPGLRRIVIDISTNYTIPFRVIVQKSAQRLREWAGTHDQDVLRLAASI